MFKFFKNFVERLQCHPVYVRAVVKLLNKHQLVYSKNWSENYSNIKSIFSLFISNKIHFFFILPICAIITGFYILFLIVLSFFTWLWDNLWLLGEKFFLKYLNISDNKNLNFTNSRYFQFKFYINETFIFLFDVCEKIHPLKFLSNIFFNKFEKIVYFIFDSNYFTRFLWACEYVYCCFLFVIQLVIVFIELIFIYFENFYFFLKVTFSNISFYDFFKVDFYKNFFNYLKSCFNNICLIYSELDFRLKKKIIFFLTFFCLVIFLYVFFINFGPTVIDFILSKISNTKLLDVSSLNYFNTLDFFKINIDIYNLFLPLFFYFFILFIFTNIFSLLFLSFLGLYGVFIINLISLVLFWLSSILYLNNFFVLNDMFNINLGKWFVLNLNFIVNFDIYIDTISFSFMFLTTTIAVFVYIYAFSYFRYEPNVERFILLINCFVISMILLVISGNFFVLFLGWELIGLTSFFLINFWSTRMSTVKSAFKAFVFNKISDIALLSVVLLVYFCFNEINIIVFNQQISYYNTFFFKLYNFEISFLELISFFFILCAFIKSAQFGFHVWLPDSMEAPVPASALIHSATLVSAGIFILLRFGSLFEYSIYAYYIIPVIGSFTAFFGGLCSAYQSDIKKILAYSTISHCGFLMVCYSTYITEFTILYLYIHGFFKAAVFLCVGNVIRFSRNCQDFRRMGFFFKYLPFECFSSFICLINLSGLPFTIGFYIKHLLLIGVYLNNFLLYFIFLNILGGAVFGLIYSYRLFYYVFFDFKKSKKIIYNQSNRNNLNSFFYSNSSLASNLSIFGLIVVSYCISIYLLNVFLNKSSLGEGLIVSTLNSSQYDEFLNPTNVFYNNIGYFNWILLIFIFLICFSSWRTIYNYYLIFNNIYYIILFLIFFFIFLFILI